MNYILDHFKFINQNYSFKNSLIKSIKCSEGIIFPIKSKKKYQLSYEIIDIKFKKVGIVKLKYKKKNIEIFLEFLKTKTNIKSKKNYLKVFLDNIFESLILDEVYITNSKFIKDNEIQGYYKSHRNNLIILKKSQQKKSTILTAGPSISEREKFYAYDAAESGWNSKWSQYLSKFENLFSDKIGRKYSIATSSCTGAMQIALMSLNIGKGDEVIVPDITWVSTASVVQSVGATPVFADVNKDDWTICEKSILRLISKRTKAIMPVHLYGMSARLEQIRLIAKKYNLFIIEDAAPAIGSKSSKFKSGTVGEFSAFSFQGAKLLVTGEGGMLTTDNKKLYEKARKIWDFGRNPIKTFWIDDIGVKYKMSNLQSALGLGQLERLDQHINKKRKIFKWYKKYLSQKNFKLIEERKKTKSIYWMTSIQLNKYIDRESLVSSLRSFNIDTRPCFPSISDYPIWRNFRKDKLINSKIISKKGLNLPSGVLLKEQDIKKVSTIINRLTV